MLAVKDQAIRAALDLLLAVYAQDKVLAVIRMGREVDSVGRITLVLHVIGGHFAIDILREITAQVDRIKEKRFGAPVHPSLARDANDELLAVAGMMPQVVAGRIAIVVDVIFNLRGFRERLISCIKGALQTYGTLGVLGQVAHSEGGIPMQIRGTIYDPRETIYARHILVAVAGVRMQFKVDIDGTDDVHTVKVTLDIDRVPTHLHIFVKVENVRALALHSVLVLAEDPVLAGTGIGYKTTINDSLAELIHV